MSGFALIFDRREPMTIEGQHFVAFRDAVAHYKELNSTYQEVSGQQYAAVKFNTPTSLHQRIITDERTGSWLLAVGTVLDSGNNPEDGDLQFLLTNYLELGSAALQSLDGPFALLIYNNLNNKLVVISDPLGFISVFYAWRGNKFYVATSALAVAKAVQSPPAEFGIYLFLTSGGIYGKSTLWQTVERLLPGTVLEVTSTGSSESVYWVPVVKDEITRLSLSETVDYVLDSLSRSITNALKREGKTWVDLTGGFDSRLVTMLMHYGRLPFKANCHGPLGSRDVMISSSIARKFGWDYQHFMLPEDWGQRRYRELSRALGKGDGHLDLFKLTRVLRDQDERMLEYGTAVWGLGGELWRGFFWRQELWNIGTSPDVNYDRLVDYRILHPVDQSVFRDTDRVAWVREELKLLLKSVGDRYPDLPNTVKLDYIYAYKNTAHTGAHISAVMGQQRAIAPLFFKESITCAISTNFKWRNHSRLVRVLMEKLNPVMADFETTAGGPALPMRFTNLHKFVPYFILISNQLVRKISREFLGWSLLPDPSSDLATYPLSRWRQLTLDCITQDKTLDPAKMYSGRLYNTDRLVKFIEQAHGTEFKHETFLSRILTVEMALREAEQPL